MSPSGPRKRVTIDLENFHEDGLEQLAGLIPHASQEELMKVVISRGLVEMLASEFERYQPSISEIAENMNAAKGRMQSQRAKDSVAALSLRASVRRIDPVASARVPFGMTQSLDELHVREAERDREMARMNRDLGLAETPETVSARRVENYIGIPLTEGLRQALESLVNAHPDLEEENLFAALLELGLTKAQEDPKALGPTRSAQDATMPFRSKEAAREKLRVEWRLLCQKVARGWR